MVIVRRFIFPALLALAAIASTAAAQSSDVTVELDQFGVGSWFRPGGITAIRLKLTSLLDEAEVQVVEEANPPAGRPEMIDSPSPPVMSNVHSLSDTSSPTPWL